ncbi:MAG: hypothetical protein ACOCRX_09670, partial [Candidatus Woesearchaeota archaeon]
LKYNKNLLDLYIKKFIFLNATDEFYKKIKLLDSSYVCIPLNKKKVLYPNLKILNVKIISSDVINRLVGIAPKLKIIKYSNIEIDYMRNRRVMTAIPGHLKGVIDLVNNYTPILDFQKYKFIVEYSDLSKIEKILENHATNFKKISIILKKINYRTVKLSQTALKYIHTIKKIKIDGNVLRWPHNIIKPETLSHSVVYLNKYSIKSFKFYTKIEEEYHQHKNIFLNRPESLRVYGLYKDIQKIEDLNEYFWLFLYSGLKKLHIRCGKLLEIDTSKCGCMNGIKIKKKKNGIKLKREYSTKSLNIYYDNLKKIKSEFSDLDIFIQ